MDKGLDQAREFQMAMGHPVRTSPALPLDRGPKRINWLLEEVGELAEAIAEQSIVKALDALGDIQFLLNGTFHEFGLAHLKQAALDEIFASNMTKLGDDGRPIYGPDNKVQKGPNYRPPDLAPLLRQQASSEHEAELAWLDRQERRA